MISKKIVSILGICSLHFSVCTGGVLSVTTALAAEIGIQNATEEVAMTVVPAEMLACQSFTPNFDLEVKDAEKDPTGCASGEFCLQDYSRKNHDRNFITILNPLVVPSAIPYELISGRIFEPISAFAARDGPIYEEAGSLTHVLLKKE